MGAFAVFAVAGYGVLMVGFITKLVNGIRTRRNEATTVGLVIANDRSNHNQYQFQYAVDGQRYTAWHQGTVDCGPSDISVGGTFTVYYDPVHPNRADLCSFQSRSKERPRNSRTLVLVNVRALSEARFAELL